MPKADVVIDRLTDEKVAMYVDMGNYPATSCANDDVIALAREVQEYRTRRCDGCEMYTWDDYSASSGTGFCREFCADVDNDFACNAHTTKRNQ